MNIFKQFTKRSLKENKTRTLVTIIGIILSVAMFTATIEAFVTVQDYLINYAEMYNGKYHVGFYDVEYDDISKISEDERVEKYTYVQEIGYAEIGSSNEYKPYLYIAGIPTDFTDIMPIHLTEGRLPQNSNEIVVSDHLYSNGGVHLKLGQKITLAVGQRQWSELVNITDEEYKKLDGDSWAKLTQEYPLRKTEGEEATEYLVNTKEKTYTVVGFCVRPEQTTIEPISAPGYTAYTINEKGNTRLSSVYTVISQPSDYSRFNLDIVKKIEVNSCINYDLLMYTFNSFDSAFPFLVIGLLSLLIGLIVFGSVSLIYNSFSISVSERTKQFGILKSIGATKKQIRKSVLYEASVLCSIGIPIGLISGCLGIAITFYFLSDSIATFLAELTDLKMRFVFSPVAIIAASVISFVTVIISAYIPAKKAIKINPIESVRQSNEIKVNRRSVKVSPLTEKLFGFEATLSSKNFKRNKKKYRATVFSLFVSVVLFISASSLSTYFTDIVAAESQDMNYDVAVNIFNYDDDYNPLYETDEFRNKLYNGLKSVKGIDEFTLTEKMGTEYNLDKKYISEEYIDMMNKEVERYSDEVESQYYGMFKYNFIDDDAFRRLLKAEGLSEEGYFDKENPKALVYDMGTYIYQNDNKEKVYIIPFLNTDDISSNIEITNILPRFTENDVDYHYIGETTVKDGVTYYVYDIGRDEGEEFDESTKRYLPEEKAVQNIKISIGAVIDEKPYFADHNTNLIYPESVRKGIMLDEYSQTHAFILCEDHSKVASDVSRLVRDIGGDSNHVSVVDYAAEIESIRALVTIAKVLAYGFIVLISMIAAANVFNTISTNISLRRREFATLKSVGLTSKGMRKMMTFESILYGVKSLLFSLPVSLGMTYLVYLVASDSGYEMAFYVPWDKFIIAIASVFIIVVLSMIYSIKKVNKENTVETLRNENI
ncbi:MAG: FtsX-like permease family protein [Ruminococcaceae bacterium]|nr:FtsX-like permease family protein [Oscillospiraceae bacterium]